MTLRILPAWAAALALLAACGAKPPAAADGESGQEATYLAPPRVEAARLTAAGAVLTGWAAPGGQLRLASPAGQALFAPVDAKGQWTLSLPPAPEPRIFGLSVSVHGRTAQAEGYLLVTPQGQAALLRAGASAERIGAAPRPGLTSVDFDRGGGMEIVAAAAPGETLTLQMDGRQVAEGRADNAGRYEVSLGGQTPIKPGAHHLQLFGEGFTPIDQATLEVTPAAPLAEGPLHSQLSAAGLRVDWMTPGGGVQSTVLIH